MLTEKEKEEEVPSEATVTIAVEKEPITVVIKEDEPERVGVFLEPHSGAVLPSLAYPNDVGYDICAIEDVLIRHGCMSLVRTGIHLDLPDTMFAQVNTRSSYGKRGVILHHGVIDCGYTGEISVWAMNLARPVDEITGVQLSTSFEIRKGDKIGQLLFHKAERPRIEQIRDLPVKERGDKGHGSTGR